MLRVGNPHHPSMPMFVGDGNPLRLNVLVGLSSATDSQEERLRIAEDCSLFGADSVQDVSVAGDLETFKRRLAQRASVTCGTVLAYEYTSSLRKMDRWSLSQARKALRSLLKRDCSSGYGFFTVHGVPSRRLMGRVRWDRGIPLSSRGAFLLSQIMDRHHVENPLLECFDEVLEILSEAGGTIGLGSAFRPGSIADRTDSCYEEELDLQQELYERAIAAGVQVWLEGQGHALPQQIREHADLVGARFSRAVTTALGPLPTDIALGHDHVAGAIGALEAARAGYGLVSVVTSAEHLGLPNYDKTLDALAAFRVAMHVSRLERGLPIVLDSAMTEARSARNWRAIGGLSLNPVRDGFSDCTDGQPCSICREFCPLQHPSGSSAEYGLPKNYSELDLVVNRYPLAIQRAWWACVDVLSQAGAQEVITFGSLVTGDFSFFESDGRILGASDFEFTLLVDTGNPGTVRTRTLVELRKLNQDLALRHAGMHANIVVRSTQEFVQADLGAVFSMTLRQTGRVVLGDGSRFRAKTSGEDQKVRPIDCMGYLGNLLSELIIQLDPLLCPQALTSCLYRTHLMAKTYCKALQVLCWLKGESPKHLSQAVDSCRAVSSPGSRRAELMDSARRSPDQPRLTDKKAAAHLARAVGEILAFLESLHGSGEELRTAADSLRHTQVAWLKDHGRTDDAKYAVLEERRRRIAEAVLSTKRENYDFYRRDGVPTHG